MKWIKGLSLLFVLLLTSQCATYYHKKLKYQEFLLSEQYEKAEHKLDNIRFLSRKRNRLLYTLEKGKVNHLEHDFEKSNKFFNEADLLIEDHNNSAAQEAYAMLTNAQTLPYKAEAVETIMVHYYKALNFLALSDKNAALVELRRMNLKLQVINSQYSNNDTKKYADDAFAHIMMGAVYEGLGHLNDAFIAYRNAANLFLEHGGTYMEATMPDQLKYDLLRTARLNGFSSDYDYYKRKFDGIKEKETRGEGGELFLVWETGLGPVKDEWSVNFTVSQGKQGYVTFVNQGLDLSIPFYVGNKSSDDKKGLASLDVVRVAFPKYVSRMPLYESASAVINTEEYPLEMVENINFIAKETLRNRFLKEMSKSLLRLALKKTAERQAAKADENIGALLMIGNALTEKADTRSWQSLPSQIHYTRIPLKKGTNELSFDMKTANGNTRSMKIDIEGTGGTVFRNITTLDNRHGLELIPR